MENEELIRQDMERTRESLTEKLETLENKVIHSVQQATSAVTDTVTNVKESMHEGVEKVKDAVDVRAHVDRHPWLMMGGAVMAGYALGTLLSRSEESKTHREMPRTLKSTSRPGNGHHKAEQRQPEQRQETSSWMKLLEPELHKLKGLALGVALGTVREALTSDMPSHLADQVKSVVDGITEKLGGNPVPSDGLPFMSSGETSSQGRQDQPAFESDKPRRW